jgi:hypothetical protein
MWHAAPFILFFTLPLLLVAGLVIFLPLLLHYLKGAFSLFFPLPLRFMHDPAAAAADVGVFSPAAGRPAHRPRTSFKEAESCPLHCYFVVFISA